MSKMVFRGVDSSVEKGPAYDPGSPLTCYFGAETCVGYHTADCPAREGDPWARQRQAAPDPKAPEPKAPEPALYTCSYRSVDGPCGMAFFTSRALAEHVTEWH